MPHKKSKRAKKTNANGGRTSATRGAVSKEGESFGRITRDPVVGRGLLLGLPTVLPTKKFRA